MSDLIINACPRLQTAHYVATIADKEHSRDDASVTGNSEEYMYVCLPI